MAVDASYLSIPLSPSMLTSVCNSELCWSTLAAVSGDVVLCWRWTGEGVSACLFLRWWVFNKICQGRGGFITPISSTHTSALIRLSPSSKHANRCLVLWIDSKTGEQRTHLILTLQHRKRYGSMWHWRAWMVFWHWWAVRGSQPIVSHHIAATLWKHALICLTVQHFKDSVLPRGITAKCCSVTQRK